MSRIEEILLTDLRHLINDLGKEGGLIGPSVYDTAQVLRMAPPQEGIWEALDWILEQQQPDGGWGDPATPLARDVPTLAAMMVLYVYGTRGGERLSLQIALSFLKRQALHWMPPLSDDLPVGVELILPSLLEEALTMGLSISASPYSALMAVGKKRRQLIASMKVQPGTTPVHSWEGWGKIPDLGLQDLSGSIGHSPSATAAWLRAAKSADLSEACTAARKYLNGSSKATEVNIPGVVPTAYPITRFEQAFALHALLVAGILDHPKLHDVVEPQLDDLASAIKPNGLGFSDMFIPDGDDTAEALAVLRSMGRQVDPGIMLRFEHNDHFFTYPGELQPSLSATAHAVYSLTFFNKTSEHALTYIVQRQLPDGRWFGDKWNGSWLYGTCQALIALYGSGYTNNIKRAIDALLVYQDPSGGWGTTSINLEETAYGVLALSFFRRRGFLNDTALNALERAENWLQQHYRPFNEENNACWLAKTAYRPQRLVRIIILSALLARST